jgi:hypothetical protein
MSKKYKSFNIYCAPIKKNKGYTVKCTDFESEEKMNEYIIKMRNKQKEINKKYRDELKRRKYNMEPMDVIKIDDSIPQKDEDKDKLKKQSFSSINIQNDINLILQKNTGNSTCILGSSKKGKTTLLLHLYNKFYKKDKHFICSLFASNIHASIYKRDKKLLTCNVFNKKSQKYIKLQKYINSKTGNNYKFLNMFDDIINNMQYQGLINELILSYRNSNMSTILSFQYLRLLSKMNRANVNNIIIFGSNSNESINDLITTFLRPYFIKMGFVTYHEQMNFFKYVTDNHGFFYINNDSDHISFHRIKK